MLMSQKHKKKQKTFLFFFKFHCTHHDTLLKVLQTTMLHVVLQVLRVIRCRQSVRPKHKLFIRHGLEVVCNERHSLSTYSACSSRISANESLKRNTTMLAGRIRGWWVCANATFYDSHKETAMATSLADENYSPKYWRTAPGGLWACTSLRNNCNEMLFTMFWIHEWPQVERTKIHSNNSSNTHHLPHRTAMWLEAAN